VILKVKKYPFSKKAVQAMLAATIALSPVITTGVVGSPVKVEAAAVELSQKEKDLIAQLKLIYNKLDETEQGYLRKSSDLLTDKNNVAGIEWLEHVKSITGKNDVTENSSEYKVVKGLIQLFTSTTVGSLEYNIIEFKLNYSNDVDTFFGGDLTVNDLVDFVVDVQRQFINVIKTDDKTGTEVYTAFQKAIVKAAAQNPDTFDTFLDKKIKLDAIPDVLKSVVSKVDNDKNARNAFKKAINLYLQDNKQPGDSSGGSGGGTTTPTPGQNEVTLPEGSVVTEGNTTKIPANKVQDIVNAVTADKAVIPVKLDGTTNAEVPASLFSEVVKKNAKAVVEVKTDAASYKLPASQINVADLAKQLGVAAADVQISVSVKVVDVKTSEKLASKVVEFKIEAVAGDKKQAVSTFSVYVERAITGDQNFNAKNQVAVVLDDNGKVLKSVPTLFDGKTATIKSLTNSKYAIVENNVTFPDVTSKEWAKSYIETLASKYIVKGHDTGKFAPNGTTTRAEFAVLLVRALGLPGEKYDNRFSDVKGTEWFNQNGELAAAVKHGIIEGYDTGKFNPNGKVSRAEAAAMIARAIELDFLNFDKSKFDSSKQLTKFKDANKVPAWAKEELTAVLQAGIMSGHENNTIDANGSTTRNQIAKIVAELLIKSNLMNDTINK